MMPFASGGAGRKARQKAEPKDKSQKDHLDGCLSAAEVTILRKAILSAETPWQLLSGRKAFRLP
jgi:hypothetical protein